MSALRMDPRAVIRRIYEQMWNQADPAAAQRLFAQPEGVERFVREFLAAFPDLQHTVEAIICEGDQAVARFSVHGTHTGRWKELEATGKPVHYTGVTVAHILDGRIIEHHTWWDKWELVRQIAGGNS